MKKSGEMQPKKIHKRYIIDIDENGVRIHGSSLELKKGLAFIIRIIDERNDQYLKDWLHWKTQFKD